MQFLSIWPSACTVPFSQRRQNANLVADSYDFDLGNFANDLEVHQEPLYPCHNFMEVWANSWRYAPLGYWWVGLRSIPALVRDETMPLCWNQPQAMQTA